MVLFTTFRLQHQNSWSGKCWKMIACLICLGISGMVSFGRVYLQYHTWSQVKWGAVVGLLMAFIWFLVVQIILTPFFPWLVSTRIAEFLLIRDYTSIPNIVWFEYNNARLA